MRPAFVTQMNRTSLTGQLRSTSLTCSLRVIDRYIPRLAEDVVEFQAGLGDRRVVQDLEEAGGVRHQGAIEKRLVRVEQTHQVDEPFEVGGLALELQQDTAQLSLNRLRHIGD